MFNFQNYFNSKLVSPSLLHITSNVCSFSSDPWNLAPFLSISTHTHTHTEQYLCAQYICRYCCDVVADLEEELSPELGTLQRNPCYTSEQENDFKHSLAIFSHSHLLLGLFPSSHTIWLQQSKTTSLNTLCGTILFSMAPTSKLR